MGLRLRDDLLKACYIAFLSNTLNILWAWVILNVESGLRGTIANLLLK